MSSAPTPTAGPARPLDDPFWDGLQQGELRIQRCDACAEWHWPPQWRCGACGGWDMRWDAVPLEGLVHSFTHTRHPFSAETVDQVPYANVLVTLPQAGGARLIGLLVGDEDGLAIGARVIGEIEERDAPIPALRWRIAR